MTEEEARRICCSPGSTDQELRKTVFWESARVHPNMSEETLTLLFEKLERRALATPTVGRGLSSNQNCMLGDIAGHTNSSPDLLWRLNELNKKISCQHLIGRGLAKNPNTSRDVLVAVRGMRIHDPYVERSLAERGV